jgi:hypothetical protein
MVASDEPATPIRLMKFISTDFPFASPFSHPVRSSAKVITWILSTGRI